ncbi:MAG TPA: hypothetical protein PKH77_09650 [Anaerolineae bacterium]|nr:hypothetical protein [Anaerolineae bacterium]
MDALITGLQTDVAAQDWYRRHIEARLHRALADVSSRLAVIQVHFNSYLSLLHAARAYPELHALAADFISALHPWPTHWGYLTAWAEEVAFAAAQTRQPQLLAHRAGLLLRLGDREAAWPAAQEALLLADEQHLIEAVSGAGVTMLEILHDQGRRADMSHWQSELEARLLALQPHASASAWTRAWAEFRLYSLYYRLGAHHTWQEIVAETDHHFAAVAALPDTTPRHLIDLYFIGHFLYRRCGAARKALTVFQRKLQLERDHNFPNVDEHGAGDLALIYWTLAEYDLAVAGYQQWLAWCEQNRDLHSQGISLASLAAVYLSQKRLTEAAEVLDRAEALARWLDSAYIASLVQINRANVALCRPDYPAAIADFEAWLAGQSWGDQAAFEKLNLSHAYAALGQLDRAQTLVAEAREIAAHSESEILQGLTLRHWATYQPPAEKAALLRRALEIMQRYERRLDVADCLLSLAGVAETAEERARLWDEGVHLLQEIHATAWLEGASPDQPPFILAIGT